MAREKQQINVDRCIYLNGIYCRIRQEDKLRLIEASKAGTVYRSRYDNECCPLALFPDLLEVGLVSCKAYKPRQNGEQILF